MAASRWRLAWLLALGLWTLSAGAAAPPFPADLDQYLEKHIKLTRDDRAALTAGTPITKLLDADPSKEVAAFGAVWIDAPNARYLAAVRDIERFESGDAFRITKKISSPPRPEDFAPL